MTPKSALLALTFGLAARAADADCWSVTVVDAPGRDVAGASLAIGADGPVVSYSKRLGTAPSSIEFARFTGTTWELEHVADQGNALTSVAIDPTSGEPGIAFAYSDALYFARRAAGAWSVDPRIATGSGLGAASLAYGPTGRPSISSWAAGLVRVATYDGTWTLDLVDTVSGWFGGNTGLAFDGAGRPAVAYYDGNAGDLRYAWNDGAGWNVELVDTALTTGWYPSLAFAPGDEAIVAYDGGSVDEARLARRTGADAWSPAPIDSNDAYTSVAVDASGLPAIAYADATRASIRLARWDGTGWTTDVVDASGPFTHAMSLAFDPATGAPVVAYTTAASREVRVARSTPPLVLHRRGVADVSPGWQAAALPLTAANDDELAPFPASGCGSGSVTDALPPGEALVLYRALTDTGAPSTALLRVTRTASGIVVAY